MAILWMTLQSCHISRINSVASKRLEREEYWYRELCIIYHYDLNGNVKGVENVSCRTGEGLILYTLFNKHQSKFRKHTLQRRRKVKDSELRNEVQNGLIMYKSLEFTFGLKTYMSLLV